ncbi:MAG TPA: hypothetical protein VN174_03995 [Candidatus Methanoperedens sp.]|nr:hypothetical protein [Candidatus Methanoperedens sp.]
MKIIIKLFLILIFISIASLFFVYKFFLSAPPKDLGVKYTPEDYTQSHQKMAVEVGSISSPSSENPNDSIQFSGKKDININLSSSEATAYSRADKWKYAPISNLQIKINPDGTGEVSGVLNLANILPFISMTTSTEEVQKAIDKFHISGNPPFYTKGTVTVTNNSTKFNIQSLEVGHIPVPGNYISENTNALNNFVTDRLNSIPNLQVRSLTLGDSKVNLDATVPEKVVKVEK